MASKPKHFMGGFFMYLKDIDVFLCDNSNYLIDIYTGDMFLLNNSIVVQLSRHKFNLFIMNRYM